MQTEFGYFSKKATPRQKTVPTRNCKDIRFYLDQLQWQMLEEYKIVGKNSDYYWIELKFSEGYRLMVKVER